MGHSEENEVGTAMGTVLALDHHGQRQVHARRMRNGVEFEIMMGKSSPVRVGDRLYLRGRSCQADILDANTGENLTPELTGKRSLTLGGTEMRGSPLVADGKIYVVTSSRRLVDLAPRHRERPGSG